MTRDTEEQNFVTTADEAVDVTAGIDETTFRREFPVIWWLTLVGPFVLTASVVFLVWEFAAPRVAWRLVSTAFATFFLFGKFVILGGSEGDLMDAAEFFTAEQLMLIVLYMDVMTGCLLVFHLGFLFRLPMVGGKLKELVQDGNFILKSNPWMKRATLLGLVAFVMFPLAATGSVGGSIFGRLLGLGRLATLIGIVVGSIMGCGLMYFGSELITRYVGRDNPLLMVAGIAVVAAIIYLLNYRYRQLKERQT
jgi:uncharacterized membrane protein